MKKPTELLGVKIVGGLQEVATPWSGASLLVELYRKLEMGRRISWLFLLPQALLQDTLKSSSARLG